MNINLRIFSCLQIVVSTTTSTASTSSTAVTTASTTMTSSSSSSTVTSASTTVTSSSSSTLTSTLCGIPTSTVLSYTRGPINYILGVYNYSATSSGTGVLEFGFTSSSYRDEWYLDDVSLQDVNSSNLEMLVNGDFENGTLIG
ncbi:unnamed protein product [Rotaria sordida]|uniref:Uncharacterized protein n=1 Tax=Rotaria sordida TaxID=392033 RepID=A0A814TIY4_9BILA|nr:unnamed protein product [Rotaria sordida]CAF3623264.1 unnamed protein product [Rotaria sordida]